MFCMTISCKRINRSFRIKFQEADLQTENLNVLYRLTFKQNHGDAVKQNDDLNHLHHLTIGRLYGEKK